jgi:hypothetical protein
MHRDRAKAGGLTGMTRTLKTGDISPFAKLLLDNIDSSVVRGDCDGATGALRVSTVEDVIKQTENKDALKQGPNYDFLNANFLAITAKIALTETAAGLRKYYLSMPCLCRFEDPGNSFHAMGNRLGFGGKEKAYDRKILRLTMESGNRPSLSVYAKDRQISPEVYIADITAAGMVVKLVEDDRKVKTIISFKNMKQKAIQIKFDDLCRLDNTFLQGITNLAEITESGKFEHSVLSIFCELAVEISSGRAVNDLQVDSADPMANQISKNASSDVTVQLFEETAAEEFRIKTVSLWHLAQMQYSANIPRTIGSEFLDELTTRHCLADDLKTSLNLETLVTSLIDPEVLERRNQAAGRLAALDVASGYGRLT